MSTSLRGWSFAIVRILAALAAGAAIGVFVGRFWAGLAGTLAVYLAFQLYQLFRLDYWLRHRSTMDPPMVGGVWGDVVANVVRLHRRKNYHKQRLIALFRELRRSTAAMPDGVVLLSADREIIWFNRKAGELLGLQRKTDFGLRIDNLVRHPEFVRFLAERPAGGSLTVQPKVGEELWLDFQAVAYGDGQTLLLVRDVTRQRLLETMRKDFVANASHELRSPLTVIAGYLETLGTDAEIDPQLQGPLAEMRRQAQRMTAIIADLLELSRLEATDEQVVGEPIDVAALLAVLRKDVLTRPQHPAQMQLAVDSPQRLVGDPGLIQSAFWNLVDNAAKYTPADGTVSVRWWVDEAGGHLAVSDTGPGIPAQHLPRLTERFYRVDPGRSRAKGGSGLGLAIVKHVLQRHGAELRVESVEGRGSTFSCHFPPARLAPASGSERAPALRASA
ncbi:MAG: phosphate regulon sensor histidine kinase PhoR [Steroidobacteraceae bacterium]